MGIDLASLVKNGIPRAGNMAEIGLPCDHMAEILELCTCIIFDP